MYKRQAQLVGAVRDTLGWESWKAEMTPESLGGLGDWFEGQVEMRKKDPGELRETREKLSFPIDIPGEELTNRTFSLAIDIGMYFSQVVLKNLPGTRWEHPLGDKKFVDYGQPVIVGFGTVSLNPVRVMVTTAYRIAGGEHAELRKLYSCLLYTSRCV